ncbi:multisubstrate pseudouridine synthase 7 [Lunasporangiospora selenospora]|uniref:Multisubstrate pseudouridine synthase 7 n=1 Tax=Lunasporangiospora selenospora TaxID=979761 RepID=A0A9P6G2S8_9FUNG|nr:multisubstrate pseudouridine synthase 7 [Lunasporangiospora selenospora]
MASETDASTALPKMAEDVVGIRLFVDSSIPGFSVNEVDQENKVVHLTSFALPIPDPEGVKQREARIQAQEEAEQVNLSMSEESKLAELSKLVNDDQEIVSQIKKMLDSYGNDVESVILKPEEDKTKRTAIHTLVKERYKGRMVSETVDGAIRLRMHKKKDNFDKRGKKSDIWQELGGEFCRFCLYKENRESMEAINHITAVLNVPGKVFTIAGTKDRRGITSQWVTAHKVKAERLASLNKNLRNMRVGDFSYVSRGLKLGDLNGNRFTITLRNVQVDSDDTLNRAMASLKDKGFVNYYGMQRFGTGSVGTHQIGRAIIKGAWSQAVDLILLPRPGEAEDAEKARQHWADNRDPKEALKMFPRRWVAESRILWSYQKAGHQNNHFDALGNIPRNLRMMYVHAYQSYVWNHMATERIRMYGSDKPVVGDLVVDEKSAPLNAAEVEDGEGMTEDNGNGRGKGRSGGKARDEKDHVRAKVLTPENVDQYSIYDVILPCPGYDIIYPQHELLDKYKELMAQDGLDPLKMHGVHKEYSLPGSYRALIAKPGNVEWEIKRYSDPDVSLTTTDLEMLTQLQNKEDGSNSGITQEGDKDGQYLALILNLTLGSSQYATMAIREVCKQDTSSAFQSTLNVGGSSEKSEDKSEDNTVDSESSSKRTIDQVEGLVESEQETKAARQDTVLFSPFYVMTTTPHHLCFLHPPPRSHGQQQQEQHQHHHENIPFPPCHQPAFITSCPIFAGTPAFFPTAPTPVAPPLTSVSAPSVYTAASSAMQLLDITTIHGLLLYTLYLLHRLGFFRQRYTRKWIVFFHRLTLVWQQHSLRLLYSAPLVELNPSVDDNPMAVDTHKQERDPSVTRDSDSDTSTYKQIGSFSSINDDSTLNGYFANKGERGGRCRTDRSTPGSSKSQDRTHINDMLPAEILVVVFDCLSSHPRVLLRCMLVCRSWYELLGPHVWRSPRILWSRHWSKYLPIASADSCHFNDNDYRPIATKPCTMGASDSRTTLPLANTQVHVGVDDDLEEAVAGSDLLTDLSYSVDCLSSHQQHSALIASSHLHPQDREDIEAWLLWRKREKAKQAHERARRRRLRIKKLRERQQSMQQQGKGKEHFRVNGESGSSRDGNMNPKAANISFDLFGSGEGGQNRRDSGIAFSSSLPMSQGRGYELDHPYDEGNLNTGESSEDQDDGQEQGNLLQEHDDESDSDFGEWFDRLSHSEDGDHGYENENPYDDHFNSDFYKASWNSSWRYSGEADTDESDFDSSDDETPLMKLVSGVDYLYSIMRGNSQTIPSSLVSSSSSRSSSSASPSSISAQPPSTLPVSRDMRLNQEVTNSHSEHKLSAPLSARVYSQSQRSVFSRTLARIRKRQLNIECRRQLSEMRYWDGLPSGLPLQTCGRWIQVVNLQKEALYPQKVDSQSFIHQTPVLSRRHHQSQRVSNGECYNITDEGLALVRNAPCVAHQTLVSFHLAGCWRITDRGVQSLLANDPKIAPLRLESIDLAGCFQVTDVGLKPLLRQCGTRLLQLRVSDCELITKHSVLALVRHCPRIQWLDLARSGLLSDKCLKGLAANCHSLEWLNMAQAHPERIAPEPPRPLEIETPAGSAENRQPQSTSDHRSSQHYGEGDRIEGMGDQDEAKDEMDKDFISDESIALLCESCPNLQLLDLSYITTLTNAAIKSLSETAHSLVCLTIIGCSGITSEALLALASLRHRSGKLGCITMGDALGISENDIEQIMQGSLNGWQKSLVDETNLGEILGRSWDE